MIPTSSRPGSAALALAVLAVLSLIEGCGHREPSRVEAALPAVSVSVAPVESHGITATEEVVGTVRSRLRSAIEAKLTGRIEALLVVPGQSVRQGETLVTLDAREAKARLDSALAVREQAALDFERISKLVKDGAATVSDRDGVQARQRVSVAAVVEAETMLAHSRVIAPFDGVITRKFADMGDLATPGRPLVEIEDPSKLRFEADIPEAILDRLQLGARLSVRVGSLKEIGRAHV